MSKRRRKDNIESPSIQIRKKLFSNIPAMVGLVIIVFAHVIAILGYMIMPDSSPNVSVRDKVLKKQAPGFEVTCIKQPAKTIPEKYGVIHRMLFGQETWYKILPVFDYQLNDSTLDVTYQVFFDTATYNRKVDTITSTLPKLMYNLKHGSPKISKEYNPGYKIDGDIVLYVLHSDSVSEPVHHISKKQLIKDFRAKHLEVRKYYLGTDDDGRDILSLLIYGTRISLSIGFVSVLISLFIGVILGALAGYFGGWVDNTIMWLMSVIWSIPAIILVIAISIVLNSDGIWVVFLSVGLTMWIDVARIVRGQVISVREKLYVEAAKSLGMGHWRIIFRHIMPNIIGSIIVVATSNFATAILIEAGLSFIGIGETSVPTWGKLVSIGREIVFGSQNTADMNVDAWHVLIYPSICISVLVMAFNLFGNGLRDAYDPKTSHR